jgi:hypothetical protein
MHAVREYLELEVPPFSAKNISISALQTLIEESYVLDIESDANAFSHKAIIDQPIKKQISEEDFEKSQNVQAQF